jgi:hypothetical protein
MNIKQLALGAITPVLILGLALGSNALLDRYLPGGAACVNAHGSWVNWPWANVPTLSPRCEEQAPDKKMTPQTRAD